MHTRGDISGLEEDPWPLHLFLGGLRNGLGVLGPGLHPLPIPGLFEASTVHAHTKCRTAEPCWRLARGGRPGGWSHVGDLVESEKKSLRCNGGGYCWCLVIFDCYCCDFCDGCWFFFDFSVGDGSCTEIWSSSAGRRADVRNGDLTRE